ncbi:MAG: hypothetical protein EOP84_19045 [Verrucomicrobiaceae bacterium]|nr:MAG: hypothetical protein EOP84_19045 [Verrucomicrobiaceae bacterium]
MFWKVIATIFVAEKLDQLDRLEKQAKQQADADAREARILDQIHREESARRKQAERQYARQEGARRYRKFADGKPFRVYYANGITTTRDWLIGRKVFAETYDDGKTRGYVVYEGLYDDMQLLTATRFHRRFRRWVE